MTALQEIRPSCPECQTGTIELITDGQVGESYMPKYFVGGRLETRMVSRPFGACNACEFCIELDPVR